MEDTITIKGRGVSYTLAKLGEDSYIFPEIESIRLSKDDLGRIYFIDPPNGPFIHIEDYPIDGKIVKRITHDSDIKRFILHTK